MASRLFSLLTKDSIKAGLNSYGTKVTLGGWALFGGSHLLMSSEPIRSKSVELFGTEQKFRVAYSAVSIATLGLLAYKFSKLTPSQLGPVVLDNYRKRSLWKTTSALFKCFGTLFVAEAFTTPMKNPLGLNSYLVTTDPKDIREKQRKWQVYGFQRISRHSMFFGLSLFAFGAMMNARRTIPHLILWGLLPVFSIIGSLHQEKRLRRIALPSYFEETSFIPFGAVLSGKQRLSKITTEVQPTAYAAAFVMYGMLYYFF